MITVHTGTLVVLLVAAALVGALVAVLPAWRRLADLSRLPVWTFLWRRETNVEGVAALQAEIRCALCDSQPRCRRLLAAGADAPHADCPNAALFRKK